MKKIIILNGAGKKNGSTAAMIRAFTEEATSGGNDVREFYLQGMNIKGCLDCQGCARAVPGSESPCVQKDDMTQIYAAFKEADVIVFASPVYWWTFTGTMKTAVDRLYALYRKKENGGTTKESVLLMTSGGSSIALSDAWYRGFEQMLGWKNLGTAMNDISAARRIAASVK